MRTGEGYRMHIFNNFLSDAHATLLWAGCSEQREDGAMGGGAIRRMKLQETGRTFVSPTQPRGDLESVPPKTCLPTNTLAHMIPSTRA